MRNICAKLFYTLASSSRGIIFLALVTILFGEDKPFSILVENLMKNILCETILILTHLAYRVNAKEV